MKLSGILHESLVGVLCSMFHVFLIASFCIQMHLGVVSVCDFMFTGIRKNF